MAIKGTSLCGSPSTLLVKAPAAAFLESTTSFQWPLSGDGEVRREGKKAGAPARGTIHAGQCWHYWKKANISLF
jgi:hypothetical protein